MSAAWTDTVEEAAGRLNFDTLAPEDITDEAELPFTPDDPLGTDGPYAEISPDILRKHRRANGAAGYEAKVNDLLHIAVAYTARHSATAPDAAAILIHGKSVAAATGDVAAKDPRVAAAIDFLAGGTGNPYVAMAMALAPLALQLIRNHEPVLAPAPRGIKIPFTKIRFRIPIKLGVRLGGLRAVTNDPKKMYEFAFTNPDIKKRLDDMGIDVAPYRANESG